jgi:K+-sensing histidine kinase KdpD
LISSTAEENYQWMLEMAIAIKDNINSNPIYPLAVIEDNDNAKEQIISDKKSIENILNNIKFPLDNSSIITRIDYNKVSAISRTVKEDNITDIIIGWTNKQKTTDLLFGSFIENLSESVWQNLYATQLSNTPVAIKNIY